MATVLLVEKTGMQRASFADALRKRYTVITVSSGKQAIQQAQSCHIVVLDAISLRTPGDRIARQLKDGIGSLPLIHLHPEAKAKNNSPADALLFQPFTSRKLVNTIERLLTAPATDSVLEVGHLSLNSARRVLITNGQENSLTPKLALLVEMFMAHAGETLDRKRLMETVWHTNYLGDTRTLDVHIRWIRQMIEADPGTPQYLKTVRGVGYRLELPGLTALPEDSSALELTLQSV
ncbi:MAG: response regulator transcription factor [Anaerolinea sp.]|nr:response regulator transcription factor [Anaerolinea sp.]